MLFRSIGNLWICRISSCSFCRHGNLINRHGKWDAAVSGEINVIQGYFILCRGNPPVVAPMPEMNDNSSVGGVGTGALPLQYPRFFENEIALRCNINHYNRPLAFTSYLKVHLRSSAFICFSSAVALSIKDLCKRYNSWRQTLQLKYKCYAIINLS